MLPARLRSPALAVHGLILASNLAQMATFPLLPAYGDRYGLGSTGQGLLVALPSLGMLLVALPSGRLCDRVGARRVTVAAGVLLAVGALLQALDALGGVLAGRALFGVGFGVLWTSGMAWISATSAGSTGSVVTTSAVGSVLGPALGGWLAERAGLGAPFLLFGLLCAALVAVALGTASEPGRSGPVAAPAPTRRTWALVTRSPGVLVAAVGLALVGAASGIVQLLVPLQLAREGGGSGAIGLVLGSAGVIYVVVSTAAVRLDRALTRQRVAVAGSLAMALVLLPSGLAVQPAVVVPALLLFTVTRAVTNTIAYPLAARDPQTGRIGPGVVMGLLNAVWAGGMVVGPVLAGRLAGSVGVATAYAATSGVVVATVLLLVLWLRSPASRRLPADDRLLPVPA